jgi:cell division ATPase FtsA
VGLSELSNPAISNLTPSYEIKDGFFHLKPVTFKIGNYQIIASGSNGLDKSLDYSLKVPVPASQIKGGVNSALSSLIGKNVNLQGNEIVIVDVGVTGLINNPKISTSLGEIAKGATQQLQQQAKQQLEQEAQKKLEQQRSTVQDSINKALEEQKKKQTEDLKKKIRGLFGK